MEGRIKVFAYIPQLDCFVDCKRFATLNTYLGLNEWTSVVWLGRLFTMDNDYGEHVFDNWEEREELEAKAKAQGINLQSYGIEDISQVYIICPSRFKDQRDGPCHSDELRKRFWTDVLKSLEISTETMITASIESQDKMSKHALHSYLIPDLKERIAFVRTFPLNDIEQEDWWHQLERRVAQYAE